jgi:hypothetical protein
MWNEELKCFVYHIAYIPDGKTGSVRMREGSCTDMSGAIRLFEAIDKEVRIIVTHYGDPEVPDTCYFKEGDKWTAERSILPRYRSLQ